jgi:hypothetical protein
MKNWTQKTKEEKRQAKQTIKYNFIFKFFLPS